MGCRTHPVFAYLHVHVFCLLLSVVLVLLFAIAYSLKQQPSIDLRSHSLYNNHNITATNSSTHYMVNFQNRNVPRCKFTACALGFRHFCLRVLQFTVGFLGLPACTLQLYGSWPGLACLGSSCNIAVHESPCYMHIHTYVMLTTNNLCY